MQTVEQTKRAMRAYMTKHGLVIAAMNDQSKVWGIGARLNAWRVTGHADKRHPSTKRASVVKVLWPPLRIIGHSWSWTGALGRRSGPAPGIVWHHSAGTGSAKDVHRSHLAVGYRGIGYHYYVRRSGEIHRGRPEWAIGAHCLGHNDWLGVCAEGNYESTRVMPPAQLAALRSLHRHLHEKHRGIPDRRHRDMSGNATACPGRHYPFAKVTG